MRKLFYCSIFLITLPFLVYAQTPGCSDGVDLGLFSSISTFGDSDYYVSSGSYSWEEANVICQNNGGHLVVITSIEENDFVAGLLPGQNLWIGLFQNINSPTYSEPDGGWEWVSGESFDYENWADPEPNNDGYGEEYCHMNIF